MSAETNRFGLCVLGSPGWTRTSDGLMKVAKSPVINVAIDVYFLLHTIDNQERLDSVCQLHLFHHIYKFTLNEFSETNPQCTR